MLEPRTYNTIGELIKGRYTLTAHCDNQACRHSKKLDLEALAAKLGRDHSTLHRDLAPKLKCEICGGKTISLILSPDTSRPGLIGDRKFSHAD
jgi:hypothetical protein